MTMHEAGMIKMPKEDMMNAFGLIDDSIVDYIIANDNSMSVPIAMDRAYRLGVEAGRAAGDYDALGTLSDLKTGYED